jgi:hypothetical protein
MKSIALHASRLTLVLVMLVGIALAANTGNVAGRVTDRKTGEPLIGASVVVEVPNSATRPT